MFVRRTNYDWIRISVVLLLDVNGTIFVQRRKLSRFRLVTMDKGSYGVRLRVVLIADFLPALSTFGQPISWRVLFVDSLVLIRVCTLHWHRCLSWCAYTAFSYWTTLCPMIRRRFLHILFKQQCWNSMIAFSSRSSCCLFQFRTLIRPPPISWQFNQWKMDWLKVHCWQGNRCGFFVLLPWLHPGWKRIAVSRGSQ